MARAMIAFGAVRRRSDFGCAFNAHHPRPPLPRGGQAGQRPSGWKSQRASRTPGDPSEGGFARIADAGSVCHGHRLARLRRRHLLPEVAVDSLAEALFGGIEELSRGGVDRAVVADDRDDDVFNQ